MTAPLTVTDLLNQPEAMPIWARNNVHRALGVGKEGALLLQIPKLNGTNSDILRLDRTWLPVDLTAQIPRAQLLASSEFRNAVNKKYLILISDERAQKLLRSPSADSEIRRLEAQEEYARTAAGVRSLSGEIEDETGADSQTVMDDPNDERPVRRTSGKVKRPLSADFQSWLDTIRLMDDVTLLSNLRTRRMSRREARAVLKAVDSAKHAKSKRMLERSLAKK